MLKRELEIHYQGLIYLTFGEEESLVSSILGGENYDYHYPSVDYEYESCYRGFLNGNDSYKGFADFEANHVNDALKKLKKTVRGHVPKIISIPWLIWPLSSAS